MNYRITSPLVREAVLRRDKYKCQCCGAHPGCEDWENGNIIRMEDMRVEARGDTPTVNQSPLITICPDCSDGRFEVEGLAGTEVTQ